MESNSCNEIHSIIFVFLLFFMLLTTVSSETDFKKSQHKSQTFESSIAHKKMKLIRAQLRNINKPFVKSILSPDGDIIDCVLFHLQPAFDLPRLKGKMSLDLPEIPSGTIQKVNENSETTSEIKQLWNSNDESCPNGTIPIRRTSASDILRFTKFRKKMSTKFKVDPGHEHALGYAEGEYYGGQAILNIWAPNVRNENDFSLSQIWVATLNIPNHQSNTVEAGWMVYKPLNGDNTPRLFIYWTNDEYNQTGCYNLLCSGFIQTTNELSLGAAIRPISRYNGGHWPVPLHPFDLEVKSMFNDEKESVIIQDPRSGDWWLRCGNIVMGYWPSSLFTDLRDKANIVQFGGEVYSSQTSGPHTSTQMGSGHFPNEGYKKASYVRNMQFVDGENKYSPVSDISVYAEQPNCYDVTKGHSDDWGTYIYFGGPGNNPNCQ